MIEADRREQLLRDLEAIGASLPATPEPFAELRSLLARLPAGTPPDLHAARAGVADSLAISSFGGANSQLVGDPIGSQSGGAIGSQSLLTFGQGNLLADPSFEQMSAAATTIGVAATTVGAFWRAQRVQNSGTAPLNCDFNQQYIRQLDISNNPFSSAEVGLQIQPAAAVANFDVFVYPAYPGAAEYSPALVPILPYLIAGLKVRRRTSANLVAGVTVNVRMEVYRVGDGVVVATSTPLDYSTLNDFDDVKLVWAAAAEPAATFVANAYRWRLKVSVVNTGVLANGTFEIGIAEPVFQWSWVSTMPPFSPYIGGWVPDRVNQLQSDAGRLVIEASLAPQAFDSFTLDNLGAHLWGSGAAALDAKLARGVAGQLKVSSNGAAVTTDLTIESTAAQLARLAVQVAADTTPRAQVRGDATVSGILLGPGNAAIDLRAYRSAAKILTVDDGAGGGVTLNVINALQVAGTAVSVAGHGAADHADIGRKLFLPAALAKLDVATAVNLGASPNLTPAVAYADAATQGAFFAFEIPSDWLSGITIQPVWAPGATDAVAHTVRWSATCKTVGTGVTITAAGTTTLFTGASAARTINVLVYDTATSVVLAGMAAGDLFTIELQRIGADAADTYVGVVNLLGIIVQYTANQ